MSSAIHRTTKRFMARGCSGSKNPPKDWILNPEKTNTALKSQPVRYWKISGDVVSLMSTEEMDAEDRRVADEQRASTAKENKSHFDRNSVEKAMATVFHKQLNEIRVSVGMPAISGAVTIAAIKAELD